MQPSQDFNTSEILSRNSFGTRTADQDLRSSFVEISKDVRLNVVEQGRDTSPLILCLHGYTDSWFSFSRIMPLLADSFHVVALDQRGHGASTKTNSYLIEDFARDVITYLSRHSSSPVTLIGHSFGSFVAQKVAVLAPGLLDKLILIGSAPSPDNEAVLGLEEAVRGHQQSIPYDFVRDFQQSTVVGPVPSDFMKRIIDDSAAVDIAVWKKALTGLLLADTEKHLHEISVPTLVCWGEGDQVFSETEQNNLATGLPNAKFLRYQDVGHAPHWEKPEAIANDIREFLSTPVRA